VDYARQVCEVDTGRLVEPVVTAVPVPMRDDVVRPSLDRREVTSAAPDADADTGLIKVPRVLG
jgi:Asp-tRNA(Asn)/Glu-tRNA(Gln) amidotransferase C subunit